MGTKNVNQSETEEEKPKAPLVWSAEEFVQYLPTPNITINSWYIQLSKWRSSGVLLKSRLREDYILRPSRGGRPVMAYKVSKVLRLILVGAEQHPPIWLCHQVEAEHGERIRASLTKPKKEDIIT